MTSEGMTTVEVTRKEILAVYPKIARIMADALGCDVEQIGLDVSLIGDLNAESIDFMDIVFGLERAFKVKIPAARSWRMRGGTFRRRPSRRRGT